MIDRVYLAVDLGAESGRVIAGLLGGGEIRLHELHRFSNGPISVAGTRRWDLIGLWKEIQVGLHQAALKYGKKIVSVGVDTWGVDYVLLSAKSEMLGQPYNYRDSRTDGVLESACSRVSRKEIFASTGLQFMPINTLYQVIAMQLQDPEMLAMADRFLMVPDFFHWLLCGSTVVEFTNATTTQFFDPRKRDWATELLRKFDVPTSMLPTVVTPGTKLGQLRADIAQSTGLQRIDVIAPPTHDTAAAVAAVPTDRTGTASWAYISSGTWSLIGVEVQQAILSDEALSQNVTNEGGVDGTYRLLKNVMGLWLVQQCRRSFERQGNDFDYTQLTHLATQADPFLSLVHPNDPAFLNPDDMAVAIQDWCRKHHEPVPQTEGEIVRCALESLAFKYRDVLSGIEQLTGETVEEIHIVGGGCKNTLLNQFTANACGKRVIAGPVEATALGNVLTQARAAGEIGSLQEIRSLVKASSELEVFEPQDKELWEEAYQRYRKLVSISTH
ncbi:rhamnulokinase [Planctomicrobium sp. SH668]|uniref:rhamnulokinase n=1 Tax=Planctomicrobium sp. SH668 TaxID=3448126 RepID=UPI003F5BCE84